MQRELRFKGMVNGIWWHASPIDKYWLIFWERVDYQTVCQFTGCCDRFGHKIYERDIVRCYPRASYNPFKKQKHITDHVVLFDVYTGKWIVDNGPALFPTDKYSLQNTRLECVGNVLDKYIQ